MQTEVPHDPGTNGHGRRALGRIRRGGVVGRRCGRDEARRSREPVLRFRLRDGLLPGKHREGASARLAGPTSHHRDPRGRGSECRARQRDGVRPSSGHGSARRRRHLQLRRGTPHRVAWRLSGAHHGWHRPPRLCRFDARGSQQRGPVGARAARSRRDRAPVHQARPSNGAPGQPRPHGQPPAPGRDERAKRTRLPHRPSGDSDAAHARKRALPHSR